MIDRIKLSEEVNRIIICTSNDPEDQDLIKEAKE